METTMVTVEELRKRASELGIKNIKKYKKDELIVLIEKAVKEKEVGLEGQTPEQRQALNDFIKTYNGTVEYKGEQLCITFDEAHFDDAKKNYKAKSYGLTMLKVDNILRTISFIISLKKKSSTKRASYRHEKPRGKQSLEIYNMMLEHPNWSHYKIRTIMNCTYTNVRRVWLLYVKDKFEDKRILRPTKKNK